MVKQTIKLRLAPEDKELLTRIRFAADEFRKLEKVFADHVKALSEELKRRLEVKATATGTSDKHQERIELEQLKGALKDHEREMVLSMKEHVKDMDQIRALARED